MPRRLGQHFLRARYVDALLEIVQPGRDESFLEIGAGRGALTLPLAARARSVVALELDASLVERLRPRLPANAELRHADALTASLAEWLPDGGRVVGNLPYAISSPLLRRCLDLRERARDLHLMLQEEVAERVASPPGRKSYGVLSVLFGLWADVEIVMRLPASAFDPPPRIRSAVIRARFLPAPRAAVPDAAALERLVRRAFGHRRKTLENNLQDSYPHLKENLRLLNIGGSRRAETLSVGEFARLAAVLERA
jgi:16S rRNA (adenine1518-N6/adenine1519-N6)-dimethyltransferase